MINTLSLPGLWTYTPPRICDERGWFSETFNAKALNEALGGLGFVQDNHVYTRAKGTLRGLHFQILPRSQDKLVRVLRGAVLDVAVDLRSNSPTFGQWASALLSEVNRVQLFIPKGFAHGYVSLEPETEVLYKVSDYYCSECERGLAWNDPQLSIDWQLSSSEMVLAERDRTLPPFADLPRFF